MPRINAGEFRAAELPGKPAAKAEETVVASAIAETKPATFIDSSIAFLSKRHYGVGVTLAASAAVIGARKIHAVLCAGFLLAS